MSLQWQWDWSGLLKWSQCRVEWERRCLLRAGPEATCRQLYQHPHSPAAKGSFWIWLVRFGTKPANQSQLISLSIFFKFFSRSLPFFSFSFPLFLLLNIIFLGKKVDFFYFFQNRLLRVIDSSYFLFTVHIAALNVPLRITGIGAGKPQKQRHGD